MCKSEVRLRINYVLFSIIMLFTLFEPLYNYYTSKYESSIIYNSRSQGSLLCLKIFRGQFNGSMIKKDRCHCRHNNSLLA